MKARFIISLIIGLLLSMGTISISTTTGQYAEKICPQCSQISQDLNDKGFPLKFIKENTRVTEDGVGETLEKFSQTNILQFLLNWMLWSAMVFVALSVLIVVAEALSVMIAIIIGVALASAYFITVFVA